MPIADFRHNVHQNSMMLKMFALALAFGSVGASSGAAFNKLPSTLCNAGNPRDVVHLRIIPIGSHFRVWPSAEEIIAIGADNRLNRAAFDGLFKATVCDPGLPEAAGISDNFEKRIVIYVEGEEDRKLVSLEYPSWEDNAQPVRARIGSRTVLVPAAKVRFLLDLSRELPRKQPPT